MLTDQEIVAELKYLIERGVPTSVEIVFLVLCGALHTNPTILQQLAVLNQEFAKITLVALRDTPQ